MPTHSRPLDPELWNADFFPPMTPWRVLARIAGMALAFVVWLTLSGLICVGLARLGLGLDSAALIGVPAPPLLVVLLNALGLFNRPRGERRNLRAFQDWISGPGGRRHGLSQEHLALVTPDGANTLRIEVTPAWEEQSTEKRLDDLNSWYVVWDFCRDVRRDRARLTLAVTDQAGREIGGSEKGGVQTIWILGTADESPASRQDSAGDGAPRPESN